MANYNKYKYYKKQVYSGNTWVDVEPLTLTLSGESYGSYTSYEDCMGIIPPTPVKLKLNYSNYTRIVNCDSPNTIYDDVHTGGTYSAITSAEIGDCVTDISGAFQHCSGLTAVSISNNITNINGAFFNCRKLLRIDIPSGVTTIGYNTFSGCYTLRDVSMPSELTTIDDSAFRYCSGLTSINIPSVVTSIGSYAFANCNSLASVTVNATTPPTLGRQAFYASNNCPIYVPAGSVNAYKTASNWSSLSSRIQAIP